MAAKYQYSTVLRSKGEESQNSGVSTGDIHIKPGKHPDGHSCKVATPDHVERRDFETVAVYESKEPMDLRQAMRMARVRYHEEIREETARSAVRAND